MANAVETPSQNNLMTEGSIVKSLLLFALPLIFGNLLQQLYNTADSIIVGNFVGANALAAVGSSGSPIYLLIGFSQGLAVGAGVVVSQFLGAKDHREAQEAVHTSLAIAVIMGLLLTVGGIACGRALLVAMNTPAEVLGDAVTYIRIYFGGVLFSVVYNMTAGILNAAGNSRRSLIYLAWASVTNIVLDLVFIVIFRMGVAGAAIATDISQLVSCVLSLRFLIKSTDDCRVIPREIRLHKKMAARIIRVGLPTGIQNMVISFSNVLVQASVNSYGAAAMAGFAAYMKIDGFNILPVSSISMAATTFVGQNYGAGRLDRVKKGTWVTLAMGLCTRWPPVPCCCSGRTPSCTCSPTTRPWCSSAKPPCTGSAPSISCSASCTGWPVRCAAPVPAYRPWWYCWCRCACSASCGSSGCCPSSPASKGCSSSTRCPGHWVPGS